MSEDEVIHTFTQKQVDEMIDWVESLTIDEVWTLKSWWESLDHTSASSLN